MSSMEERREARRRRRQQQEEEGDGSSEAASEISTVNGEDDLDRRRRERREARLRQAAEQEEDTSSRRSRRRQQEEDTPAEETSSYRSRRRRGQEEEEAPAAEEPAEDTSSSQPAEEDNSAAEEAAAEAARRRREEQEEEARQAAEAESRRQEQEEARKREAEERRKQQEEEDKKRKVLHDDGSTSSSGSCPKSPEAAAISDNYSFSFEEEESVGEGSVEEGSVEEVLDDVLSDAEDVIDGERVQVCYGLIKLAETREPNDSEKLDRFEDKIDQFNTSDCFEDKVDQFEDTVEQFEDSLSRFEDVVEETVQNDYDDGGGGDHKLAEVQWAEGKKDEVEAGQQPASSRPASVMSVTFNLEDSGTHHIQVPASPQLEEEIRDDVSVGESIDAASVNRHLDWTTDDQLDDNSSNDEMQGLMEEYEKLVNDESEYNNGKNLGQEIAEAVAEDDILGRDISLEDSLEDGGDNVYLISCSKKGDIPEPMYHQDCSYDYTYDVDREAGGSDSSSGREYCLSVFDSSIEYDKPICSKTFTMEQGSDDSKPVPRLTLPSDLNESSTQASSDRKELFDSHTGNTSADSSLFFGQSTRSENSERTIDPSPIQDFVSSAVKRFLCDAASLDSDKNDTATPRPSFSLQQTCEFVAESTMDPENDLQNEEYHIESTETQIVLEQKLEQEFDEDILPRIADEESENEELGDDVLEQKLEQEFDADILPRIADEELENEELGDDVLFFIPGTMEPIPEHEDTYLTEDQLNGYESCSSESEDLDPPQTMIFCDISESPEENKTLSSSSDEHKDASDHDTFVQPAFNKSVNDSKRFVTATQEPVKHQTGTSFEFSSVLIDIVQRGRVMNESLTYGLRTTEKGEETDGRMDQEKQNKEAPNQSRRNDFTSPQICSEISVRSSPLSISNFVSHAKKGSSTFQSSPRHRLSDSSDIEEQLSKDNIPPVLKSWKAKCASASSEDEDNSAHKNPAVNQAFGQVVTQLKQKDVNHSKRKVYSKAQEILCVTSLTEQFADVKVMGRAGRPRENGSESIQQDGREFFSSNVKSELHHLGEMKPVTGEYVNTEFKPKHPKTMLHAFLKSLTNKEESLDVRNNVIHSSEVRKYIAEQEEVKSFADKMSMFQTVANKTQSTSNTACSSLKQSLSNLLTDLKERSSPWDSQQTTPRSYSESRSRSGSIVTTPRSFIDSVATTPRSYSRSRSASLVSTPRFSESQQSTPRIPHESNFLKQRRLSMRDGDEADRFSSQASQIELKLSNLMNSMTNLSSKSSRCLDKAPVVKTQAENPASPRESPRSFFDNFMRRRSSTTLKENVSMSSLKQDSNMKHQQNQVAPSQGSSDTNSIQPHSKQVSQKKSGKSSPPPVATKPYKQKLNSYHHENKHSVLTKDVTNAKVERAGTPRSSPELCQSFSVQPEAPGRSFTHSTTYQHGHQHISYDKKRCNKEILPTHSVSNELCATRPTPVQSKDSMFHHSKSLLKNEEKQLLTATENNISTAHCNQNDINSVCQVPKITSYLKVKSFQMLAESFDEEISHLSVSDDNADLHLNLSDLSDAGYAQSTPRLPFFKPSSNFFCPTPRSERDESFNSPRVVNKAAKGWGAEGATEIPIQVKTPPPSSEVLLNASSHHHETLLDQSAGMSPRGENDTSRRNRKKRKPIVVSIRDKFEHIDDECDEKELPKKEEEKPGVKRYNTWSGKAPSLRELLAAEKDTPNKTRQLPVVDSGKKWQKELQFQLQMRSFMLTDSPRRSKSATRDLSNHQQRTRNLSTTSDNPCSKSSQEISAASKANWFSSHDVSKPDHKSKDFRHCSPISFGSCGLSKNTVVAQSPDKENFQAGSMPELSPENSCHNLSIEQRNRNGFTRTSSAQSVSTTSKSQYVSSRSSMLSLSSKGSTESFGCRNQKSMETLSRTSQDSLLLDEYEDKQHLKHSPMKNSLDKLAEEDDNDMKNYKDDYYGNKTKSSTLPRSFKTKKTTTSAPKMMPHNRIPSPFLPRRNSKELELSSKARELSRDASGGHPTKNSSNLTQLKNRFSGENLDAPMSHTDNRLAPRRKSLLEKFEKLNEEMSQKKVDKECVKPRGRSTSGERLSQLQKKLFERTEQKVTNTKPVLLSSQRCAILKEKFEKLTKDFDDDEISKVEDMKNKTRDRLRRLSSGLNVADIQKRFASDTELPQGQSSRNVRRGSRPVSELFLKFERTEDEHLKQSISNRRNQPGRWSSDIPGLGRASTYSSSASVSSGENTSDESERNISKNIDVPTDGRRGSRSLRSAANINHSQLAKFIHKSQAHP